jgi:hypothetical protein
MTSAGARSDGFKTEKAIDGTYWGDRCGPQPTSSLAFCERSARLRVVCSVRGGLMMRYPVTTIGPPLSGH